MAFLISEDEPKADEPRPMLERLSLSSVVAADDDVDMTRDEFIFK